MIRSALTASILLLVVLPIAFGGDAEARTVALPRHGLTLDVPAGWTLEQYGDAVLEISKGKARVWIRAYDAASERTGERAWSDGEGGEQKVTAFVERDGEVVFEVEGVLTGAKAKKLRPVVDGMLDSIDTTPYEHDTRHVDWNDGWTLDLPAGFTRRAGREGLARFESDLGYLEVTRLETLYRETKRANPKAMDLNAWSEFARGEAVDRIAKEAGMRLVDEVVVREEETFHFLEGEHESRGDSGEQGMLYLRVGDGCRVLAWLADDAEFQAEVERAMLGFRPEADPGPKATGGAMPSDRFPGEAGPPVAFDLPDGWTQSAGSNRMRLAQIEVSGVEDADVVVFYFGAGGGGDLEGNLKRWRDQMGGAEGTSETIEVAEDVRATLLVVEGTYQSSGMGGNPHGGNPHGMGSDDFRMLAAILQVPEGPLFVKWVGPEAKVGAHQKTFRAWIESFRVVR